MFLLSVLFAFLEMRFTHDRSEEMSTPRYFAKIQIPVCNCEEYTVLEMGFWTLLCE